MTSIYRYFISIYQGQKMPSQASRMHLVPTARPTFLSGTLGPRKKPLTLQETSPSASIPQRHQPTDPTTPSMSSRRIGLAASRGISSRISPRTCACCQWHRSFTATAAPLRARTEKPASGASMDPKSEISGPAIEAPRSYGKRYDGVFTPKPLPRPIGMPLPPREGENTGIDHRTREQRKKDFGDYDKHLERRKEL